MHMSIIEYWYISIHHKKFIYPIKSCTFWVGRNYRCMVNDARNEKIDFVPVVSKSNIEEP